MTALPVAGTWHPFTPQEIDRLGVPQASLEQFMMVVLASVCTGSPGWYPSTETPTYTPPQETV